MATMPAISSTAAPFFRSRYGMSSTLTDAVNAYGNTRTAKRDGLVGLGASISILPRNGVVRNILDGTAECRSPNFQDAAARH
jgi:hypothetical protein